jgi:hypothetical protein
MGGTPVTIRDEDKPFQRNTGQAHVFELHTFHVFLIEFEDLHFHHNSAVLLPDYDTESRDPAMPAEPRITSLAILAECLREVRRHPQRTMLLTGHTDTSGDAGYNLDLSQRRANNVLAALRGDRATWVKVCLGKHKVEDYQLILKWVSRDWGFDCDPGKIDNVRGKKTDDATEAFHKQYNIEFKDKPNKANPQGRTVTQATWEAFFDVYMTELAEILDVDDTGLQAMRNAMTFISEAGTNKQAVGCGENFPKEKRGVDGFRSRENRRVEILFFDPNEEPKLECHAGTTCKPKLCEVNNAKIFKPTIIPVPPVMPRFVRLRVRLKLQWLDPNEKPHVFPKEFPVVVQSGIDPDDTQIEKTADDGLLAFFVDKRKNVFTLQFESTTRRFLATATPATKGPGPEREVFDIELDDVLKDQYLLFALPSVDHGTGVKGEKWSLRDSTWSDGTTQVEEFSGLASRSSIGSQGKPLDLILDPNWQFVGFEYFDRVFGNSGHGKKRIRTPRIVVEGFYEAPTGPATSLDAETMSNWTVNAEPNLLQCLPWILQKKNGAAAPKPDAKILLRFETPDNTFVAATSATAREIKQVFDPAELGPSAARLKLYDLPKVWKSTKYLTRLATGADKFFESLTAAELTDSKKSDKPLVFSLDDIVICDDKLEPIKIAAAVAGPPAVTAERVAIFSHLFSNRASPADALDANLTESGVFKKDPKEPWFSDDALLLTPDRNYIGTYPNWTRLLAAQGSLLDVFNQRTPDKPDRVVGARAAARLVNFTQKSGPANFVSSGSSLSETSRPLPTPSVPLPTPAPFFVAQTFFEQRYRRGTESGPSSGFKIGLTDEQGTGRVDLALVRCCNVDPSAADKEVAVCLNYYRFFFDFNPAPKPPPPATAVNAPSGLTGAAAEAFIKNSTLNVPKRWNGPDPGPGDPPYAHSSGPPTIASVERARIEPRTANPKLRVDVVWFAQSFDASHKDICHFIVSVFVKARASMGSQFGTGQLELGEDKASAADPTPGTVGAKAGSFTFGHECGHASGLPDEYVESASGASYFEDGVYSNTPGSPYNKDANAMMRGNREVRPRSFWHIAEWLHFLDPATDFQVKHSNCTYFLPHMSMTPVGPAPAVPTRPYLYTHVNWPLVEQIVPSMGTRGLFTLFLYPLGEEPYSKSTLSPRANATLDGLLVVVVKIKFTFANFTVHNDIRNALIGLLASVDRAYNDSVQFIAKGRTAGGHNFNRCLLQFQPRVLVEPFVNDPAGRYAAALALQAPVNPGDPTLAQQYATLVRDIENMHRTVNPRSTPAAAAPAAPPEWTDFHVTTRAAGGAAWTAQRELAFQVTPSDGRNVAFEDFFAEMIGIDPRAKGTAAAYRPLVQQVLPAVTDADIVRV